ncbi:MAG: diguanylate cyclase [Ruminococcus sp.]|nr:diguanylate cyclase [Ruminococcus sp.]
MAKQKNNVSSGYIWAMFFLCVFCVLCAVSVAFTYKNGQKTHEDKLSKVTCINNFNNELTNIDYNAALLISGLSASDKSSPVDDINSAFKRIEEAMAEFENTGKLSKKEAASYESFESSISVYYNKLNSVAGTLKQSDTSDVKSSYLKELTPLSNSVNKSLSDLDEAVTARNDKNDKKYNLYFICNEILIAVLSALGLIAIFVARKKAKKTVAHIAQRDAELTMATERAEASKQAVQDIAFNNILTELPNRYLLESQLKTKLGKIQFDIALFDIDGFKKINDTYGYETGDQCLANIALMLKKNYGQYADIYNINGDEFCLVFRGSVSTGQSLNTVSQIRQQLCAPLQTIGVISNNTASACFCRCYQGDMISPSTLLMRLESALHSAKEQGGNCLINLNEQQ